MADHQNKVSLLGRLIMLLCFTRVNGDISQNCSEFQSYSWRSILRRSELSVQFMLLTRRNADCAQFIKGDNDIENSNFNGSLPTKIIMHGFRLTGSKPSWIDDMAKELINAMDVNVVIVDWIIGATALYSSAVDNLDNLGEEIGTLIQSFVSHGSTRESFHLIGVSLGAHLAGNVGRVFDGKLGRITGLDPAGPKFSKKAVDRRLDPGDAVFVEAIHSDSDYFGISQPVGHIDFYLNDGKDQPGCTRSSTSSVYKHVICDHMRAVHLYISSIKNHCPLVAFPCLSYELFINGECVKCQYNSLRHCPQIGLLDYAGMRASIQPREVKAFLMTSSHAPFCVKHFLVELMLGEIGTHNQRVEMIFLSNNYKQRSKLQLLITNKRIIKKVISHDVSLGNMTAVNIKLLSTWHQKAHVIPIEMLRITELPLNDRETQSRCIYDMVINKVIFQELVNC
ncbi:phospholipase A1 member A [Hypanus sabinus]|uniref:phospholipase A1 member A n=1 Tax=Hypanus sabinus TaxID=79690 RepID=UPI0028C418FA|nr:phospholipase A1 member A [Hypanus sabinus]